MKKILLIILCILLCKNTLYAETVYDDNYKENPNYLMGNKFLQNSQYSSAISEFKKAIRTNPNDTSSLIGLSNSYSMRAAYYNNTAKSTENAISDLKSALFFLKYFPDNNSSFASAQTILGMEKNLKALEGIQNKPISADDRDNSAKNERIKGEFAAAAYDYHQINSTPKYSFTANSALGDIYKIFNRPEKALIFYKKSLAVNPDSTDTHLKLARTYEQMNDFDSSLKEYDYALKTSSEREDILNSLERIWQKKVDEFPNDAEAHANLGVVFQKEKRYVEALSQYQKAEALNPSNLNTKINIGTLYQEQNKFDQAINTYDSILKVQPYNSKVLTFKAECLQKLNRNDEAIGLYKTALNLDPQNAQIKAQLFELLKNTMPTEQVLDFLYKNVQNSPMNADSYYELAYELHKANKIDDAIVYYLETIKLNKNKIDAYINLSQAYRQKKNYEQAFQIISKAKNIAPENKQVIEQYNLISNEYSSNRYSAASNAFESGNYNQAIEQYKLINPPTADSLLGIAAAYQALENYNEAINFYKKALNLSPQNPDIPYYIASLYINLNDTVSAKPYIEQALNKNPNNKQAKEILNYINEKNTEEQLNNAVELYDNKKYNEAITLLSQVITANNKNATAYYYRALCYDALNNYKKAISDYKLTLKYAPEMVIAYYSLAVDYDSVSDFNSAKENYNKFIELNSEDSEYLEYAKQRVNELK